jgi:prepilin-type N-terminal cleavage/methylation domain-containing protein
MNGWTLSAEPIRRPFAGAMHGVASIGRRAGMTLVELMVVIAVVAVIAAVTIGALMTIPENARTRGTEALIAKLDSKLAQRMSQFTARRESIRPLASCDVVMANSEPNLARVIAIVRTMRQEFPEWFDLSGQPDGIDNNGDSNTDELGELVADWNPVDVGGTAAPEQALNDLSSAALGHMAYVQKVIRDNTLRPNGTTFAISHVPATTRAECLFMIITSDGADTSEFAPSEIGDSDSDGLPEFVDKWGNPIQFFLWPTHYTSPRQSGTSEANPDDPNQLLTENLSASSWWSTSRLRFENLFFSLSNFAGSAPQPHKTYPLIISAGSDAVFGLVYTGPGTDGQTGTFDDIATTDRRAIRITAATLDGFAADGDNIENHSLRVR